MVVVNKAPLQESNIAPINLLVIEELASFTIITMDPHPVLPAILMVPSQVLNLALLRAIWTMGSSLASHLVSPMLQVIPQILTRSQLLLVRDLKFWERVRFSQAS